MKSIKRLLEKLIRWFNKPAFYYKREEVGDTVKTTVYLHDALVISVLLLVYLLICYLIEYLSL
jgi:hypothetical protein